MIIYQEVSKAEGLYPNFSEPKYWDTKAKNWNVKGFFTYKILNTVPNSFICYRYDLNFCFKPESKFSLPWRLSVRFTKHWFSFFPTSSVSYTFLNVNINRSLSKVFLQSQILQKILILFFKTISWYSWHERFPNPEKSSIPVDSSID